MSSITNHINGRAPAGPPPSPPPPPPWYPVMYSYTSISNGRHGVFSPPPPRGTGYPLLPLPPTPAVLWFSNCACGPGRKENPPPPPVEQDGFPFCHTHTHTHHVFVNVWPFCLPTALLWNRMAFPFALRNTHTHTHTPTHHVSVYVWHPLSVHALLERGEGGGGSRTHSAPPYMGLVPALTSAGLGDVVGI